jgi:hypothetical protein
MTTVSSIFNDFVLLGFSGWGAFLLEDSFSVLSSSILKREIPPSCDLDYFREGMFEDL